MNKECQVIKPRQHLKLSCRDKRAAKEQAERQDKITKEQAERQDRIAKELSSETR